MLNTLYCRLTYNGFIAVTFFSVEVYLKVEVEWSKHSNKF